MALKEDINVALAELGKHVKFSVPQLNDQGQARLVLPIPAALHPMRDDELIIDIYVSSQGDRFALFTPVAGFTQLPSQEFLDALLRRQFVSGRSSGLTYAIREIDERYDALVVIANWILGSITPQQFQQFYKRFMAATFLIIDDIHEMAKSTSHMEAIHPGRS